MEKELMENKIEMRKLSEDVVHGKITADAAKVKFEKLRAEKQEIEKRVALAKTPVVSTTNGNSHFSEIAKAMVEKRAITLNGTGAINQINELIKELSKKTPLLDLVRKFTGRDSSTNIPIWSPTLAVPGAYAEGAASVTSDTSAVLSSKSLTPRAFVSLLPVSAEALTLGSVNLEAELPSIFGNAFGQSFHQQILSGTGTGLNFRGIFTVAAANTNNIEMDASIMALRELALQLQDYNNMDGVIIMNPAVYSAIMSDAAASSGEDLYKEELIRSKTIEGVKVLLTGGAPKSMASGACYAVGGRLQNYGFAIASELTIEPLRTVGNTNTFFQASVFAGGSPIIDKEFIPLLME
jgi:HK97 family phage major capsid protein